MLLSGTLIGGSPASEVKSIISFCVCGRGCDEDEEEEEDGLAFEFGGT